ncbi:MAG: hypothetical protein JSU74_12450 [Candidatus Zixiibacteriota bacterium]|nr:MAG: hypothetical protein JSU74_12450 [candidate division Zixibacteria bacterium]
MDYRGTDKDALQMLIDHELAIAELYRAYADRFSDYREYWQDLANEENEHAEEIRGLMNLVDQNQKVVDTQGFKPAAVNTSIGYLRDITKLATNTPITIRDALSTALDLEKAMIERKFFDIFDTSAPEAQAVLMVLTDGTKNHVETIETEWARFRTSKV